LIVLYCDVTEQTCLSRFQHRLSLPLFEIHSGAYKELSETVKFNAGIKPTSSDLTRLLSTRSLPSLRNPRIEICYLIIIRKHLDFEKVVTIMAAFYSARLSMKHAHFRRFVRHFFILRTTNNAGAKSTPNTPFIFQEIT